MPEKPNEVWVTFTKNHWPNTDKSVEFFQEIIFPDLEDYKRSKNYPLEQYTLIIIDNFKGQDDDTLKKPCAESNCDVVIVPHNLTNKFQPLELSVIKAAKSFIQNRYNDGFADHVFTELQNGKDPTDVKILSKLSNLKPIHARWIVDWYNYVIKEKVMMVRGFNSAGISEAVQNAEDIYEKIEKLFRKLYFILVKLLVFFFKISLLKKKNFLVFFPLSNLTQRSTVNFGHILTENVILPI